MRDTAGTPPAKWTGADYDNRPLDNWKPPPLVYPCSETEKTALQQLITDFAPLKPYRQLEAEARADDTLVTGTARLPEGYYAFLENTAEKCTSPQTKHSQKGMQGAQRWVQRVDTAEGIFNRLTDGYGIRCLSLVSKCSVLSPLRRTGVLQVGSSIPFSSLWGLACYGVLWCRTEYVRAPGIARPDCAPSLRSRHDTASLPPRAASATLSLVQRPSKRRSALFSILGKPHTFRKKFAAFRSISQM